MNGQKSESEVEEANNVATIDSLIQLKAMMREKKASLKQANTDDTSKLADIDNIGYDNRYASDVDELKLRLLQDWNQMNDDKKLAKQSAIRQKAERRDELIKSRQDIKIQKQTAAELKAKLRDEFNKARIKPDNQKHTRILKYIKPSNIDYFYVDDRKTKLKDDILTTDDAYDFVEIENIEPDILNPGFHYITLNISDIVDGSMAMHVDISHADIFAHELRSMIDTQIVRHLIDDLCVAYGIETVINEGVTELTVYEAGKLVLKDCIDSLGSDKDKVDIDSFTPAYKMLVQLCLHFLIELGMITQPGIASLQPSIILTMTRSFISCLLKAAIHRESDGEVNMRYGSGDNGSRMYDWMLMLNKWMFTIQIQPVYDVSDYVYFNCVYHGDKILRVAINSHAFNDTFTYDDLGAEVSSYFEFSFVFMSLMSSRLILGMNQVSCYDEFSLDMDMNKKNGKGPVCAIYVAEVITKSLKRYVNPMREFVYEDPVILADTINDIRVVCKRTAKTYAVLKRMGACYPDTAAGRHNSEALLSMEISISDCARYTVVNKIERSQSFNFKLTSEFPLEIRFPIIIQDKKVLTKMLYDIRRAIFNQLSMAVISKHSMFGRCNGTLPELIKIDLKFNEHVSAFTGLDNGKVSNQLCTLISAINSTLLVRHHRYHLVHASSGILIYERSIDIRQPNLAIPIIIILKTFMASKVGI